MFTPVSKQLADRLATELDGAAAVLVDLGGPGMSVRVTPVRDGARSFGWTEFGDEIIVQIGEVGGRWELTTVAGDLAFLADLVTSVIAGRVSESFGDRRSRVAVTLADGSTAVETGFDGLTAIRFRPRWSRITRYSPYR